MYIYIYVYTLYIYHTDEERKRNILFNKYVFKTIFFLSNTHH